VILGSVSVEWFRFVDFDFIMVGRHGVWYDGWCCKGGCWWGRMLTGGRNRGWLVDWEVLFGGEVDVWVFDGIVVEFSSVQDVSFRNDFPKVSSGVFDVADVSFVELISVGAPGVTPPNKGWEWRRDWRCHGESFGVSESLS